MSSPQWRRVADEWKKLWEYGAGKRKKEEEDQNKRGKQRRKKRDRKEHHDKLKQITLHGKVIQDKNEEEYGDTLSGKPPQVIRLLFQNIDNLPEDAKDQKSIGVVNTIIQREADITMMNEIGLNIGLLSQANQSSY